MTSKEITSEQALNTIKNYLLKKLKEDNSELGSLIIKENIKVIEEKLKENEMSLAEHLTLRAECNKLVEKIKDFTIELLIAKTHQYDKLVEKVKEFFVAYHAEETEAGEYDEYGFPKTYILELDEKFKVIAEELKAMVGYKNEN